MKVRSCIELPALTTPDTDTHQGARVSVFMTVCVWVWVWVCVDVCMCVHVSVCECECECECVSMCACEYMCPCACVCVCVCVTGEVAHVPPTVVFTPSTNPHPQFHRVLKARALFPSLGPLILCGHTMWGAESKLCRGAISGRLVCPSVSVVVCLSMGTLYPCDSVSLIFCCILYFRVHIV